MLNELKKLVIAQKMAALPLEAPSSELAPLHAALIHYDQIVSATVIQAIQGAAFQYPREQVTQLQSELDHLFDGLSSTSHEVDHYRKYKLRLDQMIDLVEQVGQNHL